jgi:hypothetical protein
MKKLLSFLVAGIAALGLASCSGDLHNEFDPTSELAKALFDTSIKIEDFETFELAGDMQSWDDTDGIKFTQNEEGTWETDFVAPDAEDMGFCFLTQKNTVKGTWAGQVGGDKIEADSLPDGVKYVAKDNGFGGYNAVLSGLKAGTTYKMTVDASTGVYVISVEKTTAAKPTPFYLIGAFVRGSMNAGAASGDTVLANPSLDKSTYEVTYTYDFDLASNVNWGQNVDTEVSFGITIGSDWTTKYTGATFAFGTDTDFVQTTSGAQDNNLITGLNNTKAYRLIIKTTPEKTVSFKVIEVASYSLKVVVTGLPDSANGKTAIFAGTFNDWPQWTSAWNKTGKVSDHVNAVIISNEADLGVIASGLGNIGESVTVKGCGYYGTATADDIATADGEIKIDGSDVVIEFELTGSGTYTATIDLENDEVTVAKN